MADFVKWNVQRVDKKRMRCSLGLAEEFTAVFQVKMSQINTEEDKKPKIFQNSKFLCIFCFKDSTDFVDCNVLKGQQGKSWLSSSLSSSSRRDNCLVLNEKSQIDTENVKNLKVFQFPKILFVFFQIFHRLCELERWKGSTKERICCPVCLDKR